MTLKVAVLLLLVSLTIVSSQTFRKDRVCSSPRNNDDCNQLQRGNSEVNCYPVQDAVECAKLIANGTVEFGVFTAENAFHIGTMRWEGLTVIKELRHTSRVKEPFDYQSVAIVRQDHQGGTRNLRGMDFCHPGLHQHKRHERWTEAFLKHFERTVVQYDCNDGVSPAEIEAAALAKHFNAACRPGAWSMIESEDAELKERFPKLCELCDDVETCSYDTASGSTTSHAQALQCMRKSTNAVAYVALGEAIEFFDSNPELRDNFKYLCPNNSYQVITDNNRPCVWLSQPWTVIVSNIDNAIGMSQRIQRWTFFGTSSWESALTSILSTGSSSIYNVQNIVPLVDYVNTIRPIPAAIGMCRTTATWCTHSYDEKEKCDVLTSVALTLGILPIIECSNPRSDAVSCLSDVQSSKADFVGVDSNYGYLARHVYNLTAALFEETEENKYSSVIALIKESDAQTIKNFQDFRGKRACFPEYGGIASVAFINVAKQFKIFKREDCEFGEMLGEFFNQSCLPGANNIFHDPKHSNPDNLCRLCQTQLYHSTTTERVAPLAGAVDDTAYDEYVKATTDWIEGGEEDIIPFNPDRSINCAASISNRFFGTRGALTCLNEVGDVAVLEHQNLVEHAAALKLNPNSFRILCKNGSLADQPGFDVDPECFMTTIVDGEIIIRRNNTLKNAGIINALLSLDAYLQSDPDFKMYNIFNGEKNLLFEDSALGLVSPNDTALSQSVQNYIKLFSDVENCISETGSASQVTFSLILSFTLIVFTFLIRN